MKAPIFLLLFLIPLTSVAQFSIQGFVFDAESNTPLPGANVFIANTTKGVSTDVNGAFKINGLQAVPYELVISFVGYGMQVISIVPGQPKNYKVMLGPSVHQLREVVVKARKQSRMEWLNNLRMFEAHFVGVSENARRCSIENPRVLNLEETKGVLTATADTALIITNSGLGYRVKVLLHTYEFDKFSTRLYYEGQMAYELISPSSEKEKRHWAKNRLKAYYGSQMHFFRAMYNHKLNEEGFYFYMEKKAATDSVIHPKSSVYTGRHFKILTITDYSRILDSTASTKEVPVLKFNDLLYINYVNEEESVLYQTERKLQIKKNIQLSQIKLRAPAAVLPDGRAHPIQALEVRGYWSWELMSESLPLDYDPDEDLKIVNDKR